MFPKTERNKGKARSTEAHDLEMRLYITSVPNTFLHIL